MKLFLSILSLIFVLVISSCSGSFDFEDTIFDNENLSNDDNDNSSIICTEEAKICPDGSSVGRVGPNCEFAVCPDFEEEEKSNQRLVFSSKPIIPMDKIYSANFDKIQNSKGEEISGQGITYSDESFSRNIYRGFNINDTYPQIWPIDLNDSSWKIGSNRLGEWQEYTLDILKSGTYLPKLKMSSLNGPQSNSSFRLYLNGNFLMDLNTYQTGSWNTWETIEYAPINLSLGENQILRVEVLSSGSDWHSLWFEEYTLKDEIKKLEVFFEASSTSINSGESATLTWTSINANSCSGTGFSTGGKTSGSIKVSPSSSTTYTLTCSGLGKSLSKNIKVSLNTINDETDFSLSSLSYEFGGPSKENPGLGKSDVYYIDSFAGNDKNDGLSPEKAWKTLDPAFQIRSTFKPGTMVLFKRGGDWRPKWTFFNNMKGTIDKPITLGAYGDLSLPRPRIHAMIDIKRSSHIMLRDLDFLKVDTTSAQNITIYNNIVRGSKEIDTYPSNGIQAWGGSSHIAMVSNFIYDIGANDALGVHGGAGLQPLGYVWMIDNDVIGNSGLEDGIDLAMSPSGFTPVAKDVKVVGNRVQVSSVNGISTLPGRGGMMINGGHGGAYIWYVGNTLGYSGSQGIKQAGDKRAIHFSGNIIIEAGLSSNKNSVELYNSGDANTFYHNTIIQTTNRDPIASQNGQFEVKYNLVYKINNSGNFISTGNSAKLSADNNWYGPSNNLRFSYKSFDEWKKLGYDINSGVGPIPGISLPPKTSFNSDPRNWKTKSFLNYFIPDSSFTACLGENTPGAFDCEGNRLGMEILPFDGLENNGFGWSGPLLVQIKLKEMGIKYAEN